MPAVWVFLVGIAICGNAGGQTQPDDHGNTFADATPISLDTSRTGVIQNRDFDYFRLEIFNTVDVRIFTEGNTDTVGSLFDDSSPDPILLVDNGDISPGNFLISYRLSPSTYYITVRGLRPETTGTYTLTVQTDDLIDMDGDTTATATMISLDTSRTGVLHIRDDVDYFELEIRSTVDVSIFTESNIDTMGRLFDDSETLLVVNGDLNLVNFLIRSRLPPGTYYISVQPNRGVISLSEDPYTLTVQTDDLMDMHGDTPATATTIGLNTSIAGELYGGNVDYFRIEVSSTVDVSIFTESRVDTTGRLYDGLFSLVAFNDDQINPLTGRQSSRDFRILDRLYPGSTYYIEVRGFSSFSAGEYTLILQSAPYTPMFCMPFDPKFNDPLYGCQWHLNNTGQNIRGAGAGVPDEDINVESVWEIYKGEGVHVAVVDGGLHSTHEDLRDNVVTTLNYDYTPDTPLIYNQANNHGTAVGGLIAARDENGLGVRGVAPRATISGYNFLDMPNTMNAADAMTRNSTEIFVSNNSWGIARYGGTLNEVGRLWEMAIDTGVNEGAGGKGIVYVWSAGNGGRERVGDNANYEGYTNYYAVTAVCAVNNRGRRSDYSELGANLWVCAPSGDFISNIVTTDNAHRYRNDFSGTSASAPIVSGVVALVRQANPELSWRDVKLILAASARQNDSGNSGWQEGAYQYQSTSERYRFNHEYGFGVVDAQAAVNLAQNWKNVPSMNTIESEIMPVNQIIPDNSQAGITDSIEIASDIDFIEFVEINIDFEHQSFADLYTELISPAGVISELTVNRNIQLRTPISGLHRLGSAKHLGEDPSGIWQLRVSDRRIELNGRLNAWGLKIYGHSVPSLIVTTSEQLTEQNLHSAELVLTLEHLIWEEPFEPNAFSLNGAPMGVSIDIDGVTRDSSATATLTLAFDGADFDDDAAVSVMVMETAHSGDESLMSTPLIMITANHEATGMPLIEGTPRVNEILTAMVGTIADDDGVDMAQYRWQWQASTDRVVWEDIVGASAETLIVPLIHQGQFLRATVGFTDNAGLMENLNSLSVGPVLGIPVLTISTQTTLNEVNLDGAELDLMLVNATWSTSLQSESFNLDGAPTGVGIATVERHSDTTITLTLAFDGTDFDDDAMVSVLVSMAALNDVDSLMSQPIIFYADPEASITGIYSRPSVSMRLGVSAVWNDVLSNTDFKLNGVPPEIGIMEEVFRDSDLDARLMLEGNISMDSTLDFSVTILPTAYSGFRELSVGPFPLSGNYEATGMPDIVGTPQVGVSLTATIGDIADINGLNNVMSMSLPVRYNWQSQASTDRVVWEDIEDADTETLIPLPVHQGRFLRVLVSFTDDAGFPESRVSTATAAVLAPPSVTVFTAEPLTELNLNGATLTLVITGASWETTLQVDDFSLVDAPLGVVIAAVERNTDTTAILTVEFNGIDFDNNTAVSVQTSNTAIAEYVGAAVISTGVVDILANDEAVGEPMVVGVAQVGMILTATIGTITDGNGLLSAVYEWQWQASTDRVVWEDIEGADTETWIPLSVHRGQFLRVLVSFTDGDGFRESSTSTATEEVLAPPPVIILVPQAAVGSTYDFTIPDDIFTELGGVVMNYMIEGLPDSLSFNEDDRTINGVPESTGIYTVVIEASNSTELLIVNFELIIVAAGFPIVVNPLESYEVVAGVFFEFSLVDQQIFIDSTPIDGTLTYRVMQDLPVWLTFNNGVFSGTPDGSVRRIPVSVSAIDEDGNENVYVIAFDVLVNLRMRLKVFLEGAQ